MCEDTEKDDSDGLEHKSHFRLLRPLFFKKSLIDLRNDLSGLLQNDKIAFLSISGPDL